ncbi:MAG: serine/threonine protein kinase [Burkholderiales bacterium]
MVDVIDYRNSLPLGSMLLEYRLDQILGSGGFGITYLGWDTHLEKNVAIKEYLPVELAVRALDGAIVPINTGTEHDYKWGLERFLQEARLLARFTHPNIVHVNRYFEGNGTAYMVMNYEEGESFSRMLREAPFPSEYSLRQMLMPLLDGLSAVHAQGFLHRDIKPSNLFIRKEGGPLLIDFGSARLASGHITRTMTSIVSPGYAPLEQYSKDGDNQGAWTDIYSLAGVMYRAVTNENPPDAVTRLRNDPVMDDLVKAKDRYSSPFLHAINRGMTLDEKNRPRSVKEWKAILAGQAYEAAEAPTAPGGLPAAAPGPDDEPTARNVQTIATERMGGMGRFKLSPGLVGFGAGALALFLVMGSPDMLDRLLAGRFIAKPPTPPPVTTTTTTTTITTTPAPPPGFETLDTNKDGVLTPEEVKDAPLAQRFAECDKDRDGRLSPAEFLACGG